MTDGASSISMTGDITIREPSLDSIRNPEGTSGNPDSLMMVRSTLATDSHQKSSRSTLHAGISGASGSGRRSKGSRRPKDIIIIRDNYRSPTDPPPGRQSTEYLEPREDQSISAIQKASLRGVWKREFVRDKQQWLGKCDREELQSAFDSAVDAALLKLDDIESYARLNSGNSPFELHSSFEIAPVDNEHLGILCGYEFRHNNGPTADGTTDDERNIGTIYASFPPQEQDARPYSYHTKVRITASAVLGSDALGSASASGQSSVP